MPSNSSVDVQCPFQGCPIRLSVKTNRYSNLRRHITETKRHSKEPLPITCIQPGCNQIVAAFPDFDTFMFEHYLYEHYRLRINHRPRRSKKDQPARDNPLDNDGNGVEDVDINEQQTADNRYVNGGGFDHGVHNADGEPEDEYTPPWNANEPENGYAVDNLNGEVDQTDALGLFDDPINDAQWNTVEEYVAAAAAENELDTVDELEYDNEEMNESVGTERTAGMNGITYDYSRMVIQEADRKLLDFMKVVMKNRVTRQFYTELMETLLFREWKESGQAANFPENIRTSKRRCMQMFSGLIKIQYPKLHDEATPYVSLISVVKGRHSPYPSSTLPLPHLSLLLTLCTLMANQQTASDLVPSSQLQSLTEQVSRQGSQLQSLAEQVLSLTQQVSRQGSQLQMSVGRQSITPGHLAQQGLQLQNQIAELSEDPRDQTNQLGGSALRNNNSSQSSSPSRLHVVGSAFGLSSPSLTSKSLFQTFFPSAVFALASLRHPAHAGSWEYTKFLSVLLAYVAADLGLTLVDTGLNLAARHFGFRSNRPRQESKPESRHNRNKTKAIA